MARTTKFIAHPTDDQMDKFPKEVQHLIKKGKEQGFVTHQELLKAMPHIEDDLILLDETGKQLSSEDLAKFIQARANGSTKNIVFLIGGAYGVSEAVKKRANYTWSLSKLVFPHQLVRLILDEQVYRACSINRNEKYHHS